MYKISRVMPKFVLALLILAILVVAGCGSQQTSTNTTSGAADSASASSNIKSNVATSFNKEVDTPQISASTFVDPMASVIGNVQLGDNVYVAPMASVRGDEGQPIFVGNNSNIQDGVVLHALETEENGEPVEKNLCEVNGQKYSVYIGSHVSLAHQSQVHGPAVVGNDTFIGMQALVFKAKVGSNCVVEPGAKLLNGVVVADGRYVPAGMVVTTQEQADKLPVIDESYSMKDLNKGVLHVNEGLAASYLGGSAESH
ncbi:carbonate dehydratase [Phosphitispora sp. TUW77]|uniref:carbonate dehydratase n=1 Tax=Phosphitispora sp. TUW77 TaxID=3152361 RepID=UPI003AB7F18C